jgi:hypothetical protein
MRQDTSSPAAEQLRAELVQTNRDICGMRQALQTMRVRRADLRDKLRTARAAVRGNAADPAADVNRDVGGEG